MRKVTVQDENGALIEVGTEVVFGMDPGQRGVVTAISEPDADYDDELGRGVMYPPKVTVRFPDGTEDMSSSHDITPIGWHVYPDGPDELVFEATDVEVAT